MQRDDGALAFDIVYAAARIGRFIEGLDREDFHASELVQSAVIRECSVIGEAARHFSETVKLAHPEIPWPKWVSFRNRLIHAYFNTDLDTVWDAITGDLGVLVEVVKPLIPPDDESTGETE
jgi:uncharacterized protein with HEPN domain